MSTTHVIEQGEGIDSIAHRYGFLPDTIWRHPENQALRELRVDGNILFPGDQVHVPDRVQKTISAAIGQRHRIRRKGVPSKFRLQLFTNRICRAHQRWELEVDGKQYQGTTDEAGMLEIYIDPEAQRGTLIVGPARRQIELLFGELDPIIEDSGYETRLSNLGFLRGDAASRSSKETRVALWAFQWMMDLPLTGEADNATRAALEKIHDRSQLLPQNSEEDPGDEGAAAR